MQAQLKGYRESHFGGNAHVCSGNTTDSKLPGLKILLSPQANDPGSAMPGAPSRIHGTFGYTSNGPFLVSPDVREEKRSSKHRKFDVGKTSP